MKKYNVLWRLEHNGKVYDAGDVISLKDDVAAPLLTAGVLEDSGAEEAPAA